MFQQLVVDPLKSKGRDWEVENRTFFLKHFPIYQNFSSYSDGVKKRLLPNYCFSDWMLTLEKSNFLCIIHLYWASRSLSQSNECPCSTFEMNPYYQIDYHIHVESLFAFWSQICSILELECSFICDYKLDEFSKHFYCLRFPVIFYWHWGK